MELLDLLAKQWGLVAQAPIPFFTMSAAMFGAAYAVSVWYHKRQIANLKSDNDTLENKHNADVHHLERRIEGLNEDNSRYRLLLQDEKLREASLRNHEAPNHKVAHPIPVKQLTAEQPVYSVLAKSGLIKLDDVLITLL